MSALAGSVILALALVAGLLIGSGLAELRQEKALELARRYGGIDGDHHKAWVIDQMVRKLAGARYAKFVSAAKSGEDGPGTYDWDEGVPP